VIFYLKKMVKFDKIIGSSIPRTVRKRGFGGEEKKMSALPSSCETLSFGLSSPK